MGEKGITYSMKISGLLASLTAFICTALIFFKSSTINMVMLIHALSIIIPATIIMGFLGHLIGKIFDSTRKKRSLKKFIR